MVKTTNKKLVVGLEVGSYKISVLVGEILPDNTINIIGIGNYPSTGIDKGKINNLDLVVKCIKKSISQAELMADCHISSVYLSVSEKNINYQNEIGIIPLSEDEITQDDIDAVLHTAKSVRIPDEHRILHVIPQEYTIDYQNGVKNPIGLSGVRMQANVHLITCQNNIVKNIIKAVTRCSLRVDELIYSGLASSYSVLTEDEMEIGVCMVDIGGGTMDIAIYTNGSLRYTKVIPYAGHVVTNDIAYAFSSTRNDAERIKLLHGCALRSLINKDESIDIPTFGSNSIKNIQKKTLSEIIELRYTELLNLVNSIILKLQEELKYNGLKNQLGAGIVLTGGGSKIIGLIECAKKVFNFQVRLGKPLNITGLLEYAEEPYYSTPIGLLHYGKKNILLNQSIIEKNTLITNWFYKITNWLKKEF